MEEKWRINFVFFFDTNYLLHSINLLYKSRKEVKLMTCPTPFVTAYRNPGPQWLTCSLV